MRIGCDGICVLQPQEMDSTLSVAGHYRPSVGRNCSGLNR